LTDRYDLGDRSFESDESTLNGCTPLLQRAANVSQQVRRFDASLIVDDEMKIAIQERAPALHLQRNLERRGEASLFEKAVREAAAGVISLEEACKFREVGSTVSLE
jgi:thiamine monophosphate synthase